MTNLPPKNSRDPLLDAILRDEPWAPVHAAAHAAALRELSTLRRRHQARWTAAAVALAACAAAAIFLPPSPSSPHLTTPAANLASLPPTLAALPSAPPSLSLAPASPPSSPPDTIQHITEAQLLALFPKGSCVVAEINGQTQLVFFDHKVETEGAPYHPGS